MKYFDLVNDENCNIFTDTSFKQQKVLLNGKEFTASIASPGAIICDSNMKVLESMVNIIYHSTVPRGEIMGILYGLELGYKYAKPGQTINIFSDSKISVNGVRDWIFDWINNQRNGFLFGHSNSLINNQIYFLGIIYSVLRHNVPVRFYHVKSHLDYMKLKDREIFCKSFVEENNIRDYVLDPFITYLIIGNSLIDDTVKLVLSNTNIQNTAEYWYNNSNIHSPLEMMGMVNTREFVQSLDMNRYKYLIGKEG